MKRILAATLQDMIDVFEDKIDELGGNHGMIASTTWIDTTGLFGEVGARYTDEEMRQYWDEEHEYDQVLLGFNSFDEWYKATVREMEPVSDEGIDASSCDADVFDEDDEYDMYFDEEE